MVVGLGILSCSEPAWPIYAPAPDPLAGVDLCLPTDGTGISSEVKVFLGREGEGWGRKASAMQAYRPTMANQRSPDETPRANLRY